MSYCIKGNKVCPHLKFNQKGNYLFHCNFDKERPVQICEIDLRVRITCPLDRNDPNRKTMTEGI